MQLITDQESPNEEYLCDYVYIDNLRLSHYYAQLSKNALVTNLKTTAKEIGKQGSDLQLKTPIIGGKVAGERTTEEWQETQIDSAFSRPQQTLDALYDAGFIHDEIEGSRIGSLVLSQGSISLFDIRLMRELWPAMGEMLSSQETSHIPNENQRKKAKAAKKADYDTLATLISKLPHSLQGNLTTGSVDAWFTLKPECMLLNPEDLAFKHGSDLSGEWHVLGILDALPENDFDVPVVPNFPAEMEIHMRTLLLGLRGVFGRPPQRYGITPVMIFRIIKKQS